jgi:hypothetical protein
MRIEYWWGNVLEDGRVEDRKMCLRERRVDGSGLGLCAMAAFCISIQTVT